jgi:hypothetical protein
MINVSNNSFSMAEAMALFYAMEDNGFRGVLRAGMDPSPSEFKGKPRQPSAIAAKYGNQPDHIFDLALYDITSRVLKLIPGSVPAATAAAVAAAGGRVVPGGAYTLNLSDCLINDTTLSYILKAWAPRLHVIWLDGTLITERGLGLLEQCVNLRALHINRCWNVIYKAEANRRIMPAVNRMMHLRDLHMSDTRLSGRMLSEHPQLKLSTLEANRCPISVHAVRMLAEMCHDSLAHLSLSGCSFINTKCMHYLLRFEHLETVDLSFCTGLEPGDLRLFVKLPASSLASLRTLTVTGVPGMTAAQCQQLANTLSRQAGRAIAVVGDAGTPGRPPATFRGEGAMEACPYAIVPPALTVAVASTARTSEPQKIIPRQPTEDEPKGMLSPLHGIITTIIIIALLFAYHVIGSTMQPAVVHRATSAPSPIHGAVAFERKITGMAFGSLRPPSFIASQSLNTPLITPGTGGATANGPNGNYVVMPRDDFMDSGFDQKTTSPAISGRTGGNNGNNEPRFVPDLGSPGGPSPPNYNINNTTYQRLTRADWADARTHTPMTPPPAGPPSSTSTGAGRRGSPAPINGRTLLSPSPGMSVTSGGTGTEGMTSPFSNHSAYSLHNATDFEAPSSVAAAPPPLTTLPPSAILSMNGNHSAANANNNNNNNNEGEPSMGHHVPVDLSHYLKLVTADAARTGRPVSATAIAEQFAKLAAAHDAALGISSGATSSSSSAAPTIVAPVAISSSSSSSGMSVGMNGRVGYPPLLGVAAPSLIRAPSFPLPHPSLMRMGTPPASINGSVPSSLLSPGSHNHPSSPHTPPPNHGPPHHHHHHSSGGPPTHELLSPPHHAHHQSHGSHGNGSGMMRHRHHSPPTSMTIPPSVSEAYGGLSSADYGDDDNAQPD